MFSAITRFAKWLDIGNVISSASGQRDNVIGGKLGNPQASHATPSESIAEFAPLLLCPLTGRAHSLGSYALMQCAQFVRIVASILFAICCAPLAVAYGVAGNRALVVSQEFVWVLASPLGVVFLPPPLLGDSIKGAFSTHRQRLAFHRKFSVRLFNLTFQTQPTRFSFGFRIASSALKDTFSAAKLLPSMASFYFRFFTAELTLHGQPIAGTLHRTKPNRVFAVGVNEKPQAAPLARNFDSYIAALMTATLNDVRVAFRNSEFLPTVNAVLCYSGRVFAHVRKPASPRAKPNLMSTIWSGTKRLPALVASLSDSLQTAPDTATALNRNSAVEGSRRLTSFTRGANSLYTWIGQGVNLQRLGFALARPVQSLQRLFGPFCILPQRMPV